MDAIFAERQLLAKRGSTFESTRIVISTPKINRRGVYACSVIFVDDDKYNASINGADAFNAIECALSYINSVCVNSEDPEFFWSDGEAMRGDV